MAQPIFPAGLKLRGDIRSSEGWVFPGERTSIAVGTGQRSGWSPAIIRRSSRRRFSVWPYREDIGFPRTERGCDGWPEVTAVGVATLRA
jgi:hypothetical protein